MVSDVELDIHWFLFIYFAIFNNKLDRQCTYHVTLRRIRATIVVVGKQYHTYSECVAVALGIQHAMHMRHIVICGLPGFTVFFHIVS